MNFAFYLKNAESGCVFYVDSSKSITITNSLFYVKFYQKLNFLENLKK